MGSAKMLRRASLLAAACMLALVARAQELGESKAAIPAMRPNALTGFMAAPAHHSDKEAEDVAESLIMDNEVQRDAKATDQKLSKTMQELIGKGKEAAAKVVALEKEKKVLEEEAIEEATDVQQHEKMLRDLQKALAKERADERAAKAPKRSPPAPKPRVKPEKMARDESRFEAAPEKFATKVKAPKESKPNEKKEKPLGLKLKKPVTTKESVTENAVTDSFVVTGFFSFSPNGFSFFSFGLLSFGAFTFVANFSGAASNLDSSRAIFSGFTLGFGAGGLRFGALAALSSAPC